MALGTSLIYNGVQINNCKTLVFDQSAVLDDSGTDTMFWEYRIRVEGVVVPNSTASGIRGDDVVGVYGVPVGSAAQVVANQTLEALKQNRKPLLYTMAGFTIIEVNGPRLPDPNNGPRVVHAALVHFSPGSYRVQFEVVAAISGCLGATVLSNRWSCADTIDDHYRTTRAWRGKIRVANANINPHAFRGLALPPIIKGWKRKAMHFTGEPNALELTYEVVDEEMLGDAPPEYAVSMSGMQRETMTMIAESTTGEMNVRLDGTPGTNKRFLFQQALAILDNRLNFENFIDPTKAMGIFRSLTLIDHFGDDVCAVEAHAVVQRYRDVGKIIIGPYDVTGLVVGSMIMEKIGTPFDFPGYDPERAVFPLAYPSSFANLFACYLQEPCGIHAMPGGSAPEPEDAQEDEQDDDKPQVTYDPTTPAPDIPEPQYSQEQKEGMFLHCEAQSEYIVDDGSIGCPIAKGPTSSGPSAANIRVAPPTAKRIITLEIERLGKPPEAYDAAEFQDRNGITHWPKKSRFVLRPPTATGDGQILYVLDQKLIFALDRVPSLGEMSMGSLPWMDRQPENLPGTGRSEDQL